MTATPAQVGPGRLVLLASALALVACASPAPDRYHTLRPALQGANAPAVSAPWVLRVGPVTVPETLDREAWVVRTGSTGLQVFEQQRWPQALSSEVAQSLADHLGRLGLPAGWVAIAGPATAPAELRLRLEVLRFDSTLVPAPGISQQMRWSLECAQTDATGRARVLHSALRSIETPVAALPAAAAEESQARFERLAQGHAQALQALAQDIHTAARSSLAAWPKACAER